MYFILRWYFDSLTFSIRVGCPIPTTLPSQTTSPLETVTTFKTTTTTVIRTTTGPPSSTVQSTPDIGTVATFPPPVSCPAFTEWYDIVFQRYLYGYIRHVSSID